MSELLIETLDPNEGKFVTDILTESDNKNGKKGKNVYLKGIYMQASIKNRNGRTYPIHEIAQAVQNAAQHIKTYGGIYGELDHPQTLTINMDRISHVIKEIYMEGMNAIGKAVLLDTPMGQIAKVLAEEGTRYGTSSRGTGDVNEDGSVSNFSYLTNDLVVTPSAPGALPNPLYESLQQDIKGRSVLTLAEAVREDPAAQKYLKEELMKFFRNLTKQD